MCKAHWLRAVMITGLAILHSEIAEAELLRLECSVKEECYREIDGKRCTITNAVVSMLLEIDFEANTWVEFGTFRDGTQTSASGDLKSVTQSDITLVNRGTGTDRATISRLSGAYSYVHRDTRTGTPVRLIQSGSCNKTTKPLPSSKF